jgi:hypothetical protein
MPYISAFLTVIGAGLNLWGSIRTLKQTTPENDAFIVQTDYKQRKHKEYRQRQWTAAVIVMGSTLLLATSVLDKFPRC